MLSWKSKPTEDGVEVGFTTKGKLRTFLASLLVIWLSGTAFSYLAFQLSLKTINRAVVSLVLLVPLTLLGILFFASAFFLKDSLRSKSYSFSPTGILVKTRYFGVPAYSQYFWKDEICKFGPGHLPHTKTETLKFFANGDYVNLVKDVTKDEAMGFVEWLGTYGLTYSSEDTPLRRRSVANEFLGI